MKDNPKNVDINMKHFARFDETALDTCPSDKPDFWIALEYWGSTTAYDTCDHLSRKCGETKDTNDVQCLQHPDDSRLWYSRYKVHVHTVAATQELDTSLTCDAMAANPSVCTFEYAIDCTDPGNAEPDFRPYTPGLIHTLFSATEKPSSAPSLQPSSLPSASPTTGATFLQPGDSYTTVIAWNSEEPMVNIAKTWGYGPNGEYVSSEDQAEATIIGEQVVFAQEASVGQLVFVDESMASEAPSAMPTVSSAPSSYPSAKPSAEPSLAPSISKIPTASPVAGATASPSVTESSVPSALPSSSPSSSPVIADSPSPSALPSSSPSDPTLPVLPQMSPQNTICHTVTMTATESFALSSFAFNLDYNGCVAVTVEYQINGEGWNTMCSAHDVYGNAPDMTIVNGDSCIEVIVLEGETVEFRLSTQPSNTCVGGTTGGSTNLYGVFLQQYYTYSQSECVIPP